MPVSTEYAFPLEGSAYPREKSVCEDFVERRGICLGSVFAYIQHPQTHGFVAKGNRNDVAFLDIVRCLGAPSVHLYMFGIAGFIGDSPPFDDTGYLQKFIRSPFTD